MRFTKMVNDTTKEFSVVFDAKGDFEIRRTPNGAEGEFAFATRREAIQAVILHYRGIERAIFHRKRKAKRLLRAEERS